jgi:hypothetical protein
MRLPSLKNTTAGAVDVAISSPTTTGHEAIPIAEIECPSSMNGCPLETVATGVEAKLAAPKAPNSISKIVVRLIRDLVEYTLIIVP